jgi:hypothetical protein
MPLGDYARLITYTVDTFTHRLRAHLDNTPASDDIPPGPADAEDLPPDPEYLDTHIDPDALTYNYADIVQDNALPAFDAEDGQFEGLPFAALTTTTPPRLLRITMASLGALQQEYQTVCDDLTALEADLRRGTGPAMRAADDQLLQMRRQIDADRPHRDALATVMAQWFDADTAHTELRAVIEHARTHLHTLLNTDGADELDIASARADLDFHTHQLPGPDHDAQFERAFADARQARAAAAGGHIVTEADLAKARCAAESTDRARC